MFLADVRPRSRAGVECPGVAVSSRGVPIDTLLRRVISRRSSTSGPEGVRLVELNG